MKFCISHGHDLGPEIRADTQTPWIPTGYLEDMTLRADEAGQRIYGWLKAYFCIDAT